MQSDLIQQSIDSANPAEVLIELNEEELNFINGGFGWNDITNGIKRFGQGVKDGFVGEDPNHRDIPYRMGYFGGNHLF